MAVFSNSWANALSFFLFLLLAVPSDAFPKRGGNGNGNSAATGNTASNGKATKGNGATKGAAAGGAAGAAAGGISQATDGSTILDKTVTIK